MAVSTERTARLDTFLRERDLAAVWFATPDGFAWPTGGSNIVDRAGDVGVAAAGYDGDLRVVTNNVEAERLATEELSDDVVVEQFPWHESSLAEAVAARTPTPAAADFAVPGLDTFDPTDLRQPLSDRDVERYRSLGADTAAAVEAVCRDATPSDTERSVAADLRGRLATSGIDTPVTLVGGGERATRYRHYTPSETELGEYALVSVTARRGGLYASCTRTVAFEPPSWLTDRHAATARVEAAALAATRDVGQRGGDAGDVFDAIRDAYAAVGHEGEWQHHHQGGAAGFAGREWVATPESDERVRLPMAYAWNPTIAGAKSEDTALVTESGVETLTRTGEWPTSEVRAVGYDLAIERPAILDG